MNITILAQAKLLMATLAEDKCVRAILPFRSKNTNYEYVTFTTYNFHE